MKCAVYRTILALLAAAMTACLGPTELYPTDESDRPVSVYLVTQGWHVGLLTESARMHALLPEIAQLPDTRYLEFGWGDGLYYTTSNAGIGLLLRAALLPTPAVMHIAGAGPTPAATFPNSTIVRLQISEAGMEAMARFIASHIDTSSNGESVYAGEGLYGDSVFMQATGTYILPNTSNRWTARALRAAGMPVTPFYALTKTNVLRQVSKHGEVIQHAR